MRGSAKNETVVVVSGHDDHRHLLADPDDRPVMAAILDWEIAVAHEAEDAFERPHAAGHLQPSTIQRTS